MPINSTTVSTNKPAQSVSNDQKIKNNVAFSPHMQALQSAKKTSVETSIISHQELVALASDFKNGLIDKEQVNERFVNAVIEKSVDGKLGERDRQSMTKDIADFFADDPDFMNKLQKNLRDLV